MNPEQKSPVEGIEWAWTPYPEQSINEILANKDLYLMQMRKILQRVVEEPDYILDHKDYNGHLFAVYLLSQWRDIESFQLIINAFSGQAAEEIWGDCVHELGRFVVSTFSGDIRVVMNFIVNPDFSVYARMNAFGGLVNLYFQEEIERKQLLESAREIFSECSKTEDVELLSGVVVECCSFYAPELEEDVRRLFEADLIDGMWVGLESFQKYNRDQKRETRDRKDKHRKPVSDIHQELRNWAMFSPQPSSKKAVAFCENSDDELEWNSKDDEHIASQSSILAPVEKYPGTGRNDLCPCGSGKKYKKCCLA